MYLSFNDSINQVTLDPLLIVGHAFVYFPWSTGVAGSTEPVWPSDELDESFSTPLTAFDESVSDWALAGFRDAPDRNIESDALLRAGGSCVNQTR